MQQLKYEELYQEMGFPQAHIRFKGVWDMQDLYEFMINYFRDRKYKFHEKVYKHKHPSPFGVERQYVWTAEKEETDIYKFFIYIYIHTYDAHDIDVKLKDGSIKTYTRGRIWIEFNCKIHLFPDERWKANRFYLSLKAFLNNLVLRKQHGWMWWDVLMYREVNRLMWLARRRLKMEYDEYEQKYWCGVHG